MRSVKEKQNAVGSTCGDLLISS